MKRLERELRELRDTGRKLLVPYFMGGLTDDWTEQVAADYVAALSRSAKGSSRPLKSSTQKQYLLTLRAFFHECQRQFGLTYAFEPKRHLRL